MLRKTQNNFSCMLIDQGHEQNNNLVKVYGGAIGPTENLVDSKRWMLTGPEQATLLTEFENQFMGEEENTWCKQHEQGLSTQVLFQKHSNSLYETMMCMGNPFKDDYPELLALDSRNCTSEDAVTAVQTIKNIGVTQYQKYVSDI